MSSLPLNASPASSFPAELTNIATAFPIKPQGEKRAAVLKHIARSGRLVAVRPASQLEVRPRPEMLSTGIAELDAMTGGIPRGCLTEIIGPASSGKTSVLLATIAASTRRDESCVLIDASDSFDPSVGAAAGLDFSKLLWVRCDDHKRKARAKTPVPPNSKLVQHSSSYSISMHMEARASSPVLKLEQVLKATDLVLQSGGFGLIVLDLAGIPEKFARRIPLASWFRFQRAVEHIKTALLVISEFPCAQTCAALALKLSATNRGCLSRGTPPHTQVLEGMQVKAEILRSRLERKPVQSATAVFRTQAVRAG